ncbi:MAG: hypothetical protein ACLFTK_06075 [Anaerolineales bacterium]
MILFFSSAGVVWLGRTWHTFEEGHAVLTREALRRWGGQLPDGIDAQRIILGNQRMDMPHKRADGSISPVGLALALLQAQTLPKYQHAMRQPWNHPTRNLHRVPASLRARLRSAMTTTDPPQASEYFGNALHTLQDSYTRSHAQRLDPTDPYSPLCRLHYSPSKAHPLISPDDRVWADAEATQLKPEAEAAIQATLAAFELFTQHWRGDDKAITDGINAFVARYVPVMR